MAGEAKLQNEAIATSGAFDRFGANLKRLRIAKGLSQADVAPALHVSAPSISGWESARERPKPDRMTALAALLDAPLSQLIVATPAHPSDELIREVRERQPRAPGSDPETPHPYLPAHKRT